MSSALSGASRSGGAVFQGAAAKNGETRVLGRVEMGYHSHGLHAVWDQAIARTKSIAKLPEFPKSVEATFFPQRSKKGETPL
jgi:hypothetical protein